MTTPEGMTTRQYLYALRALELTTHGNETVKVLGVSTRHLDRLASGKQHPSPMLVALLRALVTIKKNGI